ncbi:Six-hairpin glycosidase-like protein [Podospora didyma]|uniref:Six-hairpin glycosidase-like protein n=1 Tax=Podospora didyma TaxID=330526 RepID=A0AAE0K9K6_9PEZI|nr:Six-hairpin glycosidase-like protein [Podospora didyma]
MLSDDNGGEETYKDFLAICKKINTFWVDQENRCRREAFEMLSKLQDFAQEGTFSATGAPTTVAEPKTPATPSEGDLDLDQLEEALAKITQMFDPVDFGFGTPKFPNPARLSFLLRLAQFPKEVRDVVGDKDVSTATSMAIGTLRRIRDGGLRDHIGAGFMRFSVTSDWSMPHFEKMVGENALLLGVFLDAWLGHRAEPTKELTKDDEFADVIFELGDYLTSALIRQPNGGFVTSEAADSYYRRGDQHMREGAYYLWTRREFDKVVAGGASDGQHASSIAAAYWGVQEDGNVPRDQDAYDEFINQNVLSVRSNAQELAKQLGIPASEVDRIVSAAREKLRAHREKERVRPEKDEKSIVGVNGIVVSALARTAAAIQSVDAARAAQYLKTAREASAFIRGNLWLAAENGGKKTLRRFFYGGPSQIQAFADDYAFLIDGLLDLYEATFEEEWLTWAKELQDTQSELFYDSPAVATLYKTSPPRQSGSGGFYSTELATLSHTILRLKSGMDKSQPSTNAVAASNLFRLGTVLGDKKYISQAKGTLNAFEAEILQYPWLFVSLLTGVVTARLGVKQVHVKAGDDEGLRRYYTSPRAEASVLVVTSEPETKVEEVPVQDTALATPETTLDTTDIAKPTLAQVSALDEPLPEQKVPEVSVEKIPEETTEVKSEFLVLSEEPNVGTNEITTTDKLVGVAAKEEGEKTLNTKDEDFTV